jgi:beta-alanine--pyruvate transaminase
MVNNRKWFGAMLPGVDHLPHTHLPENAFSRGEPEHGGIALADELERIVGLHDASNIAAVIVEPCAGSTGYLPPPKGYLKRLREICDKHGILLIFDEVITGFGRLGTGFAAEKFGVLPDLMTVAKGISNATVPMGGVFVRKHVFDGLMTGPENAVDLFHGYTYSAHPLACAAASAVLDIYRDEALFQRSAELSPYWEDGVHSLKGLPNVVDIRNLGLAAGIDLAPKGAVGTRGYEAFTKAFELGLMVRQAGDAIAMSPPLVIEKAQIDEIIDITARTIKAVA